MENEKNTVSRSKTRPRIDLTQDGRDDAKSIQEWAAHGIEHSRSFTALAIAKLVGKVVEDGAINEQDAELLKDCLERQQNIW